MDCSPDTSMDEILGEMTLSVSPHVGYLRDGILISDEWCRLTVGTLVLLQSCDNKIFTADRAEDVTIEDVIEAFYFLMAKNIDDAVWMSEDDYARAKAVKKLMKRCKPEQVAVDVYAWLSEVGQLMPQGREQSGGGFADWWTQLVDLIAHEYGWEEYYILWELPFVRAMKYCDAIIARRGGDPLSNEIEGPMAEALDKIEERKDNGKS